MGLKRTPLYQKHLQNNGRFIDYCGWELPVEYKGMLAEAKKTRKACGIFDASHMGEIIVKGKGALEFLQGLVCGDLLKLPVLKMQYNLFLNESAGVIDDLMVYRLKDGFMCVANASNKDKVLCWLNKHKTAGVEVIDKSSITALISLQGPCSQAVAEKVFGREVAGLGYMRFIEGKIRGKEMIVSRSGYTAEDGFEIYTLWQDAEFVWDRIAEAASVFDFAFCGLGSRDILRLEAGYPLYGHEINEDINPYEAGLGWAVKLNKDFIGRQMLLKIKSQGISKKRVGFIMQERSFARQGYILYSGEKEVGKVSSGAYSPNLDKFIGMAYVEKDYAQTGSEILVKIRGRLYKAEIVKFPFVVVATLSKEGGNGQPKVHQVT